MELSCWWVVLDCSFNSGRTSSAWPSTGLAGRRTLASLG
ncbi:hypothetical protein LINPERHAP1_LOCUS26158 [Linum perenne]